MRKRAAMFGAVLAAWASACWLVAPLGDGDFPRDAADVNASDGGGDAGDAIDAGDAADGSWCSQHPAAICEDFDEDDASLVGTQWAVRKSPSTPPPTLQPVFVTDAAVSLPYSLLMQIPQDAGSGTAFSLDVERLLGGAVMPRTLHFEAEMRLEQVSGEFGVQLLGSDAGLTAEVLVKFELSSNETQVLLIANNPNPVFAVPAQNAWTHVVLDLSFEPTPTFSLSWDDGVAPKQTPFTNQPFSGTSGIPKIFIGHVNTSAGASVRFDDVLLDYTL